MPRKKTESMQHMLSNLKQQVAASTATYGYIPNIIEFCYGEEYLNLKKVGITLFPAQQIVLKAFYRGSTGNENLTFSPEEITYLKSKGLDNTDNGDVLGKMATNVIFRELVLVWGRRSGKDFVVSIIALYEAMKLIESGNPYKKYNVGPGNPIVILTIANSSKQAAIAFGEIKTKLLASKYFRDKFLPEGMLSSEIYLLTPSDIQENIEYAKRGVPPRRGSVVIEAGHSNSDGMLGKGCFVLLLDEVASFGDTGSSSSGERIYTAMTPAVITYVREVKEQNPLTGEWTTKKVYDGKIISISSPRGKEGIFWELFSTSDQPKAKERLVCRMATWDVNTSHTRESLRDSNSTMADQEFEMEFGGEFSGTGGETMFGEEEVVDAFDRTLKHQENGRPGIVYFAHLDPALSSHNYVLCICHKESFYNKETKLADFYIVVDHVKVWQPMPGRPVKTEEVDNYMLQMNLKFHFGLVTYDQWNSAASISNLKRAGIPCEMARFNTHYKMQIYQELEKLLINRRVKVPLKGKDYQYLKNEMHHLQRAYTGHGFRVFHKKDGDVRTDDACDALAGAVWNVLNSSANRLPQTRLAYLPISPSGGNRTWMSMQGVPYGTGSGPQVANQMRRHGQLPPQGMLGSFGGI